VAAVVIDSPRWREGWGETQRYAPAPERPALRLVDGGTRRPSPVVARRRRLAVAVALGLLLAVVLGVASMALRRPAMAGSLPEGRRVHVVQPGETYWSIAGDLTDGDLRMAVDALIDANGGRALFPGDHIEVP
jgi:hypothetical protein